MKSTIYTAALQAASLLLLATSATAQASSTAVALKPIATLNCYKTVGTLTEFQEYDFATDGWCQQQCGGQNHSVMALTAGSTCYCGDVIPPADQIVSNSSCNTPCEGFDTKMCGGIGFYQVYLTGLTNNVQVAPNSTDNTSSSSSSSASPSVVTKSAATVIITASASPTGTGSSNAGSNKVGIAVGIVVGLVVAGALLGGLIFYLRQKRRRAIEEEHKRNAAISQINGMKSETSSTTDQRLDPSIFSHRRESIGSIADEMDFSRRILQVRNPDFRASAASRLA